MVERLPDTVDIDGSELNRGKYLVRINNTDVPLPPNSFYYLFRLAYHRRNLFPGWVFAYEFDHTDHQAKYLYRLKQQVIAQIGWPWKVFLNNRRGYYCLNVHPSAIILNTRHLLYNENFIIRNLIQNGPRRRLPKSMR